MAGRFRIWFERGDVANGWRWDLVDGRWHPIASSPTSYATRHLALAAISAMKRHGNSDTDVPVCDRRLDHAFGDPVTRRNDR